MSHARLTIDPSSRQRGKVALTEDGRMRLAPVEYAHRQVRDAIMNRGARVHAFGLVKAIRVVEAREVLEGLATAQAVTQVTIEDHEKQRFLASLQYPLISSSSMRCR